MSVMPMAAVLEIPRTGTFACCASGSAALAVFERVGPMIALTLSRLMNFWKTVMPCSFVEESSSISTVSFGPPPWATSSTAAWMPARCWDPYTAAGPVRLRAAPITAPPPPAPEPPWPGAPWSLHATAVSSRASGTGQRGARRMEGSLLGTDEQVRAVAGLCRARRDRAAAGDALRGRQGDPVLDAVDQQVEGLLRVRLDELERGEGRGGRGAGRLVGLDVVAVLHFVQAVGRLALALLVVVSALLPGRGHLARIRARVVIDGKQRVHGARHRDQGPADPAGGLERLELRGHVAHRPPRRVVVGS